MSFSGRIVNFYFFFSSITTSIRIQTPIHSIVSAILKIGKLNIPTLIKSLTPPYTILSTKFPIVPPINNVATNRQIFLLVNNQINAHIPKTLIIMMMMKGTGNDREIPLFNTGKIYVVSFRYLKL